MMRTRHFVLVSPGLSVLLKSPDKIVFVHVSIILALLGLLRALLAGFLFRFRLLRRFRLRMARLDGISDTNVARQEVSGPPILSRGRSRRERSRLTSAFVSPFSFFAFLTLPISKVRKSTESARSRLLERLQRPRRLRQRFCRSTKTDAISPPRHSLVIAIFTLSRLIPRPWHRITKEEQTKCGVHVLERLSAAAHSANYPRLGQSDSDLIHSNVCDLPVRIVEMSRVPEVVLAGRRLVPAIS